MHTLSADKFIKQSRTDNSRTRPIRHQRLVRDSLSSHISHSAAVVRVCARVVQCKSFLPRIVSATTVRRGG